MTYWYKCWPGFRLRGWVGYPRCCHLLLMPILPLFLPLWLSRTLGCVGGLSGGLGPLPGFSPLSHLLGALGVAPLVLM